MNYKTYKMVKAATNIISGLSMATLIVLGVTYVSFNNAFVFNNAGISVTNNPVTGEQINFILEGSRRHECLLTRVHSHAVNNDTGEIFDFDFAKKVYLRSDDYLGNATGVVDHQWGIPRPKNMPAGVYEVNLYGEFDCVYLLFETSKVQMFGNIVLIIE
jgi:hypothetical protein